MIGKMADFEVYWTAAARARAAEPLYRATDGHYQFKYLPAFAVMAIPVGLLPLAAAKAFWFAASVALLVSLIALSVALIPVRARPAWFIVLAVVIAMGKFYGHELVLGQVNLLFGAVVLLAVLAMARGRDASSGALVALAIVVKPYAVLFVPWVLARRRIAAIAALCAGSLAIAALPVPLYGLSGTIDLHREWWRTVTESTAPNLVNADNVSIAGMFSKWLGPAAPLRPLVAAVTLALLALAAVVFARRRGLARPEFLEASLLLTLVPLLSPQGWDYVFLVSTPAIALLANYGDRLPAALRYATLAVVLVIGLSLYDVMGRSNYAAFMQLSVLTVCFMVIVVALATLRIRGIA
jgi:alpha-1,2-mannosyltransferase